MQVKHSSFSVRCFDKEEDINFKMVKEVREENCSEEFMDAGQYQRNGILRYEKVFGHTFISTGGKQTTEVHANLFDDILFHQL